MASEDLKTIIENLQKKGKMAFLEKTRRRRLRLLRKRTQSPFRKIQGLAPVLGRWGTLPACRCAVLWH